MTWQIGADSTDQTINVFIKNKTLNDGSGLTGLVFNTSNLTCYYVRASDDATLINLVTQTTTGAHTDGGFVEIDATNTPGLYRLDLPDAVFASGVDTVNIFLRGATNMADTVIEIQINLVDDIWDEVLTASTHNITNSSGRRLRQTANIVIREETAQGSGTGDNQIQFDTGASAVDNSYDPAMVAIISGTGVGQSRSILQYDGDDKIATVDRNWKVLPDNTSVFQIIAFPGREHVNEGLLQGATSTTATLNTLASSIDNAYVGQAIFIRSGTGDDQRRFVVSYNGTTKVATVHKAWGTIPDTTSGYVMLPTATGDYITDPLPEIEDASDIPAEPNIPQALMLLYMLKRNNTQVTTSERRVVNDAGIEVLDAPISDNGVVFSQGKLGDA
jgi:hypothetical protein